MRFALLSKKIPPMSSQKLVKLLSEGNARFVRQSGTSHAIFEREKDGRIYRAPVIMAKSDLSVTSFFALSAPYSKKMIGQWTAALIHLDPLGIDHY